MNESISVLALRALLVVGAILWIGGAYLIYRARLSAQPDLPLGSSLPRRDMVKGWQLHERSPGAGKRLYRLGLSAWFLGSALGVAYWALR